MRQSAVVAPELPETPPDSNSGVMRRAPPLEPAIAVETVPVPPTPPRDDLDTIAEAVRLAARAGLWQAVEVLTARFPRWR